MTHALILEKDSTASGITMRLLSSLGYTTSPVRTPEQALNVVSAIKFDVILTCTARKLNDRRSLIGELKRAAPHAAVILIADRGDAARMAATSNFPWVSAVIERPASANEIRRIVEFGIDGHGTQPAGVVASQERRRRGVPPH